MIAVPQAPSRQGGDSHFMTDAYPRPDGEGLERGMSNGQCWLVINVPACVVKPPKVAVMGWSPFGVFAGTITLN